MVKNKGIFQSYIWGVIQIMVSSEDVQVYIGKLTWLCFTSLPKGFSFLTDYGPVAVLRVVMFTRQVVVPTGSSRSRCERLLITLKSYIHVSIISITRVIGVGVWLERLAKDEDL